MDEQCALVTYCLHGKRNTTHTHTPIIKSDERNRGYSFGHPPEQLFRMRFDVSLTVGFTAAMTVKYTYIHITYFFFLFYKTRNQGTIKTKKSKSMKFTSECRDNT